jgi:hypothetical protein
LICLLFSISGVAIGLAARPEILPPDTEELFTA